MVLVIVKMLISFCSVKFNFQLFSLIIFSPSYSKNKIKYGRIKHGGKNLNGETSQMQELQLPPSGCMPLLNCQVAVYMYVYPGLYSNQFIHEAK